MKVSYSVFAILFLFFYNSSIAQLEWESINTLQGGYSGGINRNGFKKIENDIYAFGMNYLYKSTNKGESWELAFEGKTRGALDITKTNKSIFYITKESGSNNIFRSTDNGKTWFSPALKGLPGNEGSGGGDGIGKYRAFCAIEAVGDNLFVMFINGINTFGYNVFYMSKDEGETWTQSFYLDGDNSVLCNDHDYKARAYMKSYKNEIIWGDGAKLCRWNFDMTNPRTEYKIPMAMYRTRPVITNTSMLLVNTDANNHLMYREIEDSLTFRKILPLGYDNYWGLNLSNDGDEVIFRFLDFKTKRIVNIFSKDGGKNWSELACEGLPRTAAEFPILKCDSNIYICPSYNGIYRSTDGMKTFKLANNGFKAYGNDGGFAEEYTYMYKYGNSMILNDNYNLGDMAFFGKLTDLSIGLQSSTDEGETWENEYSLFPKDKDKVDYVKTDKLIFLPNYILYKDGNSLMKSYDACKTWDKIDMTGLDTAGAKNITVFMFDKNNTYFTVEYEIETKYYIHRNNTKFESIYIIDSYIPSATQICSADTIISASFTEIKYTTNNGIKWNPLTFETPSNYDVYESEYSLTRNVINVGDELYAIQMLKLISTTEVIYKNALFKFEKGKMIYLGMENEQNMPKTFEILISNKAFKLENKTLFYNTGKDIYISTDYGRNFTKVSKKGVPEEVRFVNYVTSKDYIYAITDGAGLFKAKSSMLSIEDELPINNQGKISLSPNPITDQFSLQYNSEVGGDVRISLINLTGAKIADLFTGLANAGANNYNFNLANYGLAAGIYTLQIESGGSNATQKIVIAR